MLWNGSPALYRSPFIIAPSISFTFSLKWGAISSVGYNYYAEIKRKAKEFATVEYVNNKDNADFAKICNYIMERYDINTDELIEFLLAPL